MLLQHHSLPSEVVQSLLSSLLVHSKIKLQYSTRHSTPGILQTLLDISHEPNNQLVMIEAEGGRVVGMLAEMMESDANGHRPNRQCYRIWAEIMNNILDLQANKNQMVDEEEEEERAKQSEVSRRDILNALERHVPRILQAVLSYLNAKDPSSPVPANRRQQSQAYQQDHLGQLRITNALMTLQSDVAIPS